MIPKIGIATLFMCCAVLAQTPAAAPAKSTDTANKDIVRSAPKCALKGCVKQPEGAKVSARALRIHQQAIVLDTHIDVPMKMVQPGWDIAERHDYPKRGVQNRTASHVDIPRMYEGGMDGLFFSIYMPGTVTGPEAVKRSLEIIDTVREAAKTNPKTMMLADTAADIRRAAAQHKIAALMGMEGGHMIANSLPVLREYYSLGVRYMTLTHSVGNDWAGSSTDEKTKEKGLTDFGKDVVREMNRLGMMVDISHVSDKTFWDAIEVSKAPLIASHSSCRAISGHPRNMTDDMIKALAKNGGVIQINYLDGFIDNDLYEAQKAAQPEIAKIREEMRKKYPNAEDEPKRFEESMKAMEKFNFPRPQWTKIVEHIDHAAKLVGPEHVGLGSDFDGASMPEGMHDVTDLPKITDALLKMGYTEKQVTGILGGNLLRVMGQVEKVAAKIQAEEKGIATKTAAKK
jgi:membrane dipeptidase